jgi:RNA polymerase sigma factor (sigma-70 family)
MMLFEIDKIYKDNFSKIYRFFYLKTNSKEIAEDLTSQTFLTLIDSITNNSLEIDNINYYLYGIAKNIFISYLRQKYKNETIELDHNYKSINDFEDYIETYVEEITNNNNIEQIAKKYIEKLPKVQAKIITLRLFDKLTPTEIALEIDKDINYVKVNLQRAKKSLKKLIECTPINTLYINN